VYEAGRWSDGTPFYAMKSVSGRPLRDLIIERRAEERIGLLHHVIAVADAIAYAHRRNIIHRDLKPANIIVGEFGETIVIDWGLAKDLSRVGDEEASGDPAVQSGDDELTVVGSVVGTPAYMAPEQRRGERVDQRADVFAIGVMLWELCASQRMPPDDARARHRVLRQAGIDRDLVSIIDKALALDPVRRYADAGELAADLKAFKSGARIAARQYTLLALLAHWTRRHRALAVALAALVVIAAVGGLVYVRNISAARDRADRAQGAAEAALDELTLRHAQTLLTSDPSAALDVLATYHGRDRYRVEQLRAEAKGRGVAVVRAMPHTDNVVWAGGTADGAILSLSLDGTIARTARDARVSVVTRGVARSSAWAYAPGKHLLAYACNPSDVCLFDTQRAARTATASALADVKIAGLALSPAGNLLAVLSRDAVLTILDVADPAHPVIQSTRPDHAGSGIMFVDERTVAIDVPTGVEVVALDGGRTTFPVQDGSAWDARADTRSLAFGTAWGQASVLALDPPRVAASVELCRDRVVGLRFLPGQAGLVYACRAGAIGTWNPERGAPALRVQLDGRIDRIVIDPAGSYVVAAGTNGAVSVVDLETGLTASYRGHGFRLFALAAPTPEHPFVISGDVRGAVRAWPVPTRLVRVVATSSSRFNRTIFDRASGVIIATTWRPELAVIEPSGGSRTAVPHESGDIFLEQAASGRMFAAFGLNDHVELWSAATLTRTRVINTGHGSLSELRFAGDRDEFVTAGNDGRLVRWTTSGQASEIAHVDQPIDRFALVAPFEAVFATSDGALWRTAAPGRILALRGPGPRIHRMVAVRDPARVYVSYASGEVVEVDAASWRSEVVVRAAGAISEMAAAGDGRTIAITTNEGVVHIGARDPAGPGDARLSWTSWTARARWIAVAPDGLVVASYSDGTIWLYAPLQHRWLCVSSGAMDLDRITVAPAGHAAVVVESEGRMLWIDLAAARQQFARTTPLETNPSEANPSDANPPEAKPPEAPTPQEHEP